MESSLLALLARSGVRDGVAAIVKGTPRCRDHDDMGWTYCGDMQSLFVGRDEMETIEVGRWLFETFVDSYSSGARVNVDVEQTTILSGKAEWAVVTR